MPQSESFQINNLFLVSGRVEDQDADSVRIVEASTALEAEEKFEEYLKVEEAKANNKEISDITVYINYSNQLESEIAQRLA